jgi:hypothetical protein
MRDAAFFVRIDGTMRRLSLESIAADGNRLFVSGSECPDCACEIGVRGIADAPELLLYPPMSPKISSSIQWTSLPGIH